MKLLFLGTNVPDEIEYQTKNISAAGNRFQNNLLAALRKQEDTDVYNLAYLAVPMEKATLEALSDDMGVKSENEGYGFVTKQSYGSGIVAVLQSVRAYSDQVKNRLQNTDLVISYNVNYAWLNLPKVAKHYGVKSVLILADYSDTDSFCSIKQKLYASLMKKAIRSYDVVVGLSSNVQAILKPKQKFILMEGGINEDFYQEFDHVQEMTRNEFRVMYSGLLNNVTGVDQLIDVMDRVAERRRDIQLIISGKGDLEDNIREKTKTRPWLQYLGHLPYEQYIEELKKADLLVNPRNMSLPENRNNFPSKILDYLATGKPILSTKFAGWERFEDVISFREIGEWEEFLMKNLLQSEEKNIAYSEKTVAERRTFASRFLWRKQVQNILKS